MNDHPSREEFAGLLAPRRQENQAAAFRVVRHLLRQCPACFGTLSSLAWSRIVPGRRFAVRNGTWIEPKDDSRAESYDYGAAFAKAEQALSSVFAPVEPPEEEADRLFAELEGLSESDQSGQVTTDTRFHSPQFIEYLLLAGNDARYQDPGKTLRLTDLARAAAEASTENSSGGSLGLADLRAKAWAHHANALRICGQAQGAEEALRKAEAYRRHGTGDPMLRACVLERVASLRIAQRRFEEAIEQATEAGNIYRDLDKPSLLASTMVQKAIAALYGGEPYAAAAILNSAIPLVDMEDNPHLLFAALHNLVRCYVDLGRPAEALAVFTEAREIYRDFSDPILVLRAGWHEGQILRDLGRLTEAEAVLLRVRDGFLNRDLPHDAALASLDLAEVYVRQQDFAALKEIIAAAVPVFRAIGATREILASWLQLQQVAHEEQRALAVVRDLAKQLEAASKKTLSQAH
jgi:tetratricopeptide (TPR) repeat protein